MMSSSNDHHAKAEQLLEQARTENDSIRRSLVLAEAQVHATLALSAEPGTSPPGPGHETRSTARGEELRPARIEPSGREPVRSAAPDETTPAWDTLPAWRPVLGQPGQQPAAPAAEPAST